MSIESDMSEIKKALGINYKSVPEAKEVKSSRVRPITDWCKHRALIFDETGYPAKILKVKWKDYTFIYKDRAYNFMPEKASFFKVRNLISTTKYYFYNVNNPDPLILNEDTLKTDSLNSSVYREILETDLIKKLNQVHKKGLLDFLAQPKIFIPLLILIGIVYYFYRGGKIT